MIKVNSMVCLKKFFCIVLVFIFALTPGFSGSIFKKTNEGEIRAQENEKDTVSDKEYESDLESPKNHGMYTVGTQDFRWTLPKSNAIFFAKVFFPMNLEKKCPIVIYSHGLGGAPEQYAYFGKMWASRGIVSFFIDHPGSNRDVWKGSLRPFSELKTAYQKCWSGRDRALSIRFMIDRITDLIKSDNPLGKILDGEKIAVSGNDLGALASLLVAGQLPPDNGPSLKDDRVCAVLALSPTIYCSPASGKIVYADIDVPVMSFSGTKDDGIVGKTKTYQRRIPFDSLKEKDHFHITLIDADHQIYSGHQFRNRKKSDIMFQRIIMNISTVFWGTYLLEDKDAKDLLKNNCSSLLGEHGKFESKYE
ncbi:MAG: hypothetical protein Q4G69_03040 [Planctomycetia bacterium]|nr:hypothetical protein [Planctomycetia bacterium]